MTDIIRKFEDAPCVGLGVIFTSENLEDHLSARKFCTTCRWTKDCEELAVNERDMPQPTYSNSGVKMRVQPNGTYAGKFWLSGVVKEIVED